MSAFRTAAVGGLRYAAHLVEVFGWEPFYPGAAHLGIHAHLRTAAGTTAVAAGVDIRDAVGLMGLRLEQHLDANYLMWEREPERTTEDVRAAFLAAAELASARGEPQCAATS